MKLTGKESQAIVWEDDDRFEIIEDNVIDNTRWSIVHEVVVKEKESGKFYSTSYQKGATEQQDESPFEYENEVEWDEVQPVEKKIIVYEKVETADAG